MCTIGGGIGVLNTWSLVMVGGEGILRNGSNFVLVLLVIF